MPARYASLRSAVAAALLFGAGLAAAGPPTYTLTNLGTLGGSASFGAGINELGQATGWSSNGQGQEIRAFLWDSGTMRSLGTLPGLGDLDSYGSGINDLGQVAGRANVYETGPAAFLYRDGRMVDIGKLGGYPHGSGLGINNAGQVTGQAEMARGEPHAFVYTDGVMQDLGTLGGVYSAGLAINASGQVAGYAQVAPRDPREPPSEGPIHAFLSDGSVMTDLGTLGGGHSEAHGINDSGEVVGLSSFDIFDIEHAFLYRDGHMQDLGTISGFPDDSSGATDINNRGDVVGWSSFNDAVHGFLYSDGAMTDLNDLLSAGQRSEWTVVDTNGINDAGQIIATAWGSDGWRAVLLTPTIPEPSTAVMLAAGLGVVAWARRRRVGRRR